VDNAWTAQRTARCDRGRKSDYFSAEQRAALNFTKPVHATRAPLRELAEAARQGWRAGNTLRSSDPSE
jgi:hypothetical protein